MRTALMLDIPVSWDPISWIRTGSTTCTTLRTSPILPDQEYDLVVSAGTRADSFRINNNGAADLVGIDSLIDTVLSAQIEHLVLISTCVYIRVGAPPMNPRSSAQGSHSLRREPPASGTTFR